MKYIEAIRKIIKLPIPNKNFDKCNFLTKIERLIETESMIIEDLTFIYPKNIYFQCIKCGNCCNQDVPLSYNESQSGIFNMKENHNTLITGLKYIKKEKFAPCPYMNNINQCSIYMKRPISCKMYPWVAISPLNIYGLVIDGLKTNTECKGFHIGKMNKEHLMSFVQPIKIYHKEFLKIIIQKLKKDNGGK